MTDKTHNKGIKILSDYAQTLSKEEFDVLFEQIEHLYNTEQRFILNTGDAKYEIISEHAYLELERLKKNEVLKDSINKTVKVAGIVSNVKMNSNSALFCLSPCEVNGEEIGHTWVRYSPAFKGVNNGSTVIFYSEIKRYGDLKNKSGVNWQEVSYVRMRGGDNASLYEIPLSVKNILNVNTKRNERIEFMMETGIDPNDIILKYIPSGRASYSLHRLKFESNMSELKLSFHTFEKELIINSKYIIIPDKETQSQIDKLLLFEWLSKLEDWEFWGFANRY